MRMSVTLSQRDIYQAIREYAAKRAGIGDNSDVHLISTRGDRPGDPEIYTATVTESRSQPKD